MEVFSGKALGGTSRVNAMLYTRGMAAEYEGWKADGRKGWGYDDVLPLFKKDEKYAGGKATDERGRDGEWTFLAQRGILSQRTIFRRLVDHDS